MPYISTQKRERLDPIINDLHKAIVDLRLDDESDVTEGNLNYIFTRMLRMCYGDSYSEINDSIGVLSCVMMEHYRTIAAPAEAQKKYENGDVDAQLKPEFLEEIVIKNPTK